MTLTRTGARQRVHRTRWEWQREIVSTLLEIIMIIFVIKLTPAGNLSPFFLLFACGHGAVLGLLKVSGIGLVCPHDDYRACWWSPDHSGATHARPGGRAPLLLDLKQMEGDHTRGRTDPLPEPEFFRKPPEPIFLKVICFQ